MNPGGETHGLSGLGKILGKVGLATDDRWFIYYR